MTIRRGLLPLLILTSGCVSLEEAPVQRAAIQQNQRTVLLAYGAPTPFVVEQDSKGELAAKSIPGLALVVQSAQDDRDLDNSKELQTYLPPWDAAQTVLEHARLQMAKTGHRGRWVTAEEAEVSTQALRAFNGAAHVVEWRRKYYDPAVVPARDYSKLLSLDDALVLELNVAPGVIQDGEGGATPALWAVAKLYRAQSMRQLWRREESAQDDAAKKLLYDYKVQPSDLVAVWAKLAPQLAEKLAAAYALGLSGAPAPASVPAGSAAAPGAFPPAAPAQPGLSPIPQ